MDHWLTTAEAAEFLDVSPELIRRWVMLGRLTPAGKVGRSHVYWLADLLEATTVDTNVRVA